MGIFTGVFLWFSMLKLISFQATVIKHYNFQSVVGINSQHVQI